MVLYHDKKTNKKKKKKKKKEREKEKGGGQLVSRPELTGLLVD